MRHDKLGNQLELLLMLTENRQWTVERMCKHLGLQKRNLYYYFEFFKGADFGLSKHGGYYSISRQSKFISKLCDIVKFTEDEAITLKRLLDQADEKNLQVRSAKQKLERFYDFNIIENDPLRLKHAKIAEQIYKAIKEEKLLCIRGYSSPHSKSVSDRIVEPFLLMNGSHDVRAYELNSRMNKTFRLSRMKSVEIIDEGWTHRSDHRQMFTDLFNFSAEELTMVKLRLDQLSLNVLLEEYPQAERDLDGDILTTNVCSMLGIGRFVLGLYDHIEILEGDELRNYLDDKIKQFTQKG